jgi:hypothetical protein
MLVSQYIGIIDVWKYEVTEIYSCIMFILNFTSVRNID